MLRFDKHVPWKTMVFLPRCEGDEVMEIAITVATIRSDSQITQIFFVDISIAEEPASGFCCGENNGK